jgi:hypothetical protein
MKISDLPQIATAGAGAVVPIVSAGTTYQLPLSALAASQSNQVNFASQTESLIPGKWFESATALYKPIYRKVVQIGNLTGASKFVNHGLTLSDIEIGSMIVYGIAYDTVSGIRVQLPYAYPGNTVSIVIASENVELYYQGQYSSYAATVTLEYSKVSDTAVRL